MERSGLKKCDTIRTIKRNLKLKGPEPSMVTLVDFYLWNTNTHGCRRIAASKGPIKRTLWILLTMTAAAMIFWECVQLHLTYHTATMSVTMRHGKNEFPTVTICNLNPYKFNLSKHLMKDLDKMARCIVSRISSGRSAIFGENNVKACNMEFPVDPTPLVYMNMTLPANVKVMEILTGNDYLVNGSLLDLRSHSNQKIGMSDWWIALRLCDANVSNCIYNTFSSAISAMQEWYRLHFFNIMATVPEKDKIAMGYSADELIYACLYSGRTCDARDFTQFHHPHFGNCFVFNNDSSSKNLTALIPGNRHGLQLILHTEQQDYIPFFAGTAGTRIAIHSKYTKSFIEDVGINLQPATETLLGLSVSEIQKLGVPYSDCTEDGSDVPIENLYYSSYSLQICLQSCFQKEILQQCGCGHYERPLPAGYKYCNSQEFPGWEYCYYKLYSNYIAEELNCYRMCKQTCFQKEYTTKVSLAKWPSENSKVIQFIRTGLSLHTICIFPVLVSEDSHLKTKQMLCNILK
uniref:Sodium channel epithelial 1 gamma subunit n=1 Tax=Eptatretus burgeri TaxID=7764 RepID=A0A8C4RBQ6_EPTBU